jgi:uncharacterized SAM-binding protein YcdF (DUF218 family)
MGTFWKRILGCGLLLWGLGGLAFWQACRRFAQHPVISPYAVVFTGGADRVETGLRLVQEGRVRHLLISGVPASTDLLMILEAHPAIFRVDPEAITLGTRARDTIGNAVETATWLRAQSGAEHVCTLIDSDFHMPRSLWELRNQLEESWLIQPCALSTSNRPWPWRVRFFLAEYHKMIGAILRSWWLAAASPNHGDRHEEGR